MRILIAVITLFIIMIAGQTAVFGGSDISLVMETDKSSPLLMASGLKHNQEPILLAQAVTGTNGYDDDGFDDFEEEFGDDRVNTVKDPLAGYNRFMTSVNDGFLTFLIFPLARGYNKILPGYLRSAIDNFFTNIAFPVRFVNNVFQLKFKEAGIEFARFGLNTTGGVFGLVDVAQSHFNLSPQDEDFGQTLGWYGAGSGFHLVLPLLGPSNLRDTIGLIPDYFLDPIGYLDSDKAAAGISAGSRFNSISFSMDDYENLKENSVDFYLILRDGYEQNRLMKIKD